MKTPPDNHGRIKVFSTVRILLRTSFQASWTTASIVLISAVLVGSTPLALAWAAEEVINGLLRRGSITSGLIAVFITVVILFGSQWIEIVEQTKLEERTDHLLEARLMATMGMMNRLDVFESSETQERLHTFLTRPKHMVGSIGLVVTTVTLLVRLATMTFIFTRISWWLGSIPLLILFPALGGLAVQREFSSMLKKIAPSMRQARLLMEDSITSDCAREQRIFDQGSVLRSKQIELLKKADRIQILSRARTIIIIFGSWAVFSAALVGAVDLSLESGLRFTSTNVVIFSLLLIMLVGQAETTTGLLGSMGSQAGYFEPLVLLQREANRQASALSKFKDHSSPAIKNLERGISLRGVSYTPLGGTRKILDGISVDLPFGATVAIVGPNGAGKTTLVKLLLGLYRPTEGAILVDGRTLDSFPSGSWTTGTTVSFQDYAKFEFTLADDISIGDLPRESSQEDLDRAMEIVGAVDLPIKIGWNTPLGTSQLGGQKLSEGQWQKLAVARASLARDPLFLALDEPTASLDAESEAELYGRFFDVASALADRTGGITLVVSHRFTTVRQANLIIVLDDGMIDSVGTHEELMESCAWYRQVVEHQVSGYE
jgi:ATP-binding cassette subfamily B protein